MSTLQHYFTFAGLVPCKGMHPAAEPLDGEDLIVVEGEWEVQPGAWKAVSGERNRTMLVAE